MASDRGGGGVRIGVDVGGTFTDLVALVDGRVVTAKVPSTPDQSEGVLACIEGAGVDAARVDALAHGTTVATNALLERRGARTALVTTEGLRDVIEIGRQNRPKLYDLAQDRPPALVPRDLRFTVAERMGPAGVVRPLDAASVARVVRALRECDVEAVAVCLLFGYLHTGHERAVGDAIRAALPGVALSLSSDVLPEFREYERCATTCADAYLAPKAAAYIARLSERAAAAGLPDPLIMQSSGGVLPSAGAAARPVGLVLSGPAGGVVGAAHVAAASGCPDALALDMGGTSTDVAPIVNGAVGTTTQTIVGGVPIKLPAVDVHTIGAGGGSVGWIDEGGALRVGPRSAGADPGPACYARGGAEATVTDADLYLGFLQDGARLGGSIVLDGAAAVRAVGKIAADAGLEEQDAALGIVQVAEAEMARALRVISVARGLDPRAFALVAFGGAGPMHACALAEQLDMTTVLVPRAGGVLSALGLALTDLRRDYVRPQFCALDDARPEDAFADMEGTARRELPGARLSRFADVRYRGQAFELTVDAGDWNALAGRFHDAHGGRYGYRMDDEPVQVVNVRVVARVPTVRPPLREPRRDPTPGRRRRMCFDGTWLDAAVLHRSAVGAGAHVRGPAVVEFAEATCVVRPGWAGLIDDAGTLVLRRS